MGARRLLSVLTLAAVALTACSGPGSGAAGSAESNAVAQDITSPAPTATPRTAAPESLTSDSTEARVPPDPHLTSVTVPLGAGVANEASGITAATTAPGAYLLIDDGTGTGAVAAVGSDGRSIASIAIDSLSADNAEAISAGPCGATPLPAGQQAERCLYIGDIGDNSKRREDIAVIRFTEPDLAAPPTKPVLADEWHYTYPDGAQNAEAMLVDSDGSLIVVTKPAAAAGALAHRMYRGEPGGGELVFLREFSPPASQRPVKTLFTGNVVTDLAATPGRVLVLTYDDVHEYRAPEPGAELSTFPDWPHRALLMPAVPQAEGITGSADDCGYTVAAEAGPVGSTGWLGIVTCH